VTSKQSIDTVEALDEACFPDCYNLKHMDGELHYWLVHHKGTYCGYCATRVEGDVVFLARSAVAKEHRGKGLQRRMIKARERFHGPKYFVSYVSRFNPVSMNNLIRCGYRTYLPERRFGGQNAVYFYKDKMQEAQTMPTSEENKKPPSENQKTLNIQAQKRPR
jgi:GNAT superfamily N-acetyltransferase